MEHKSLDVSPAEIVSRSVGKDNTGYYCRWCKTAGFHTPQAVRGHLRGCEPYQEHGDDVDDPSEMQSGASASPAPPNPQPVQPEKTSPRSQAQQAPGHGSNASPSPGQHRSDARHPGTDHMGLEQCRQELQFWRTQAQQYQQAYQRVVNHETHEMMDAQMSGNGQQSGNGLLSGLLSSEMLLAGFTILAGVILAGMAGKGTEAVVEGGLNMARQGGKTFAQSAKD